MPTLKKESMVYPSVQDKNLGFRRVLIFCPVLMVYPYLNYVVCYM
jgi:hypothetical protein